MDFFKATCKRHHGRVPSWMILKRIGYLNYKVVFSCEPMRRTILTLHYEKGRSVRKDEINKNYHIVPMKEEDALTEIFLEH